MRTGVVVPVHGFAPYLVEALDCVLANAPDAVVVVDDGSPAPLPPLPEGVELVRRAEAGGPAVARQAGLEALTDVDGIALCDADDAWEPGHLASMQLGDHAWGFSRARIVGPDGRETGEQWDQPAPGPHGIGTLYAANPVPTSSVVIQRPALEEVGGFPGPVRVAEDWELWIRLTAAGYDALCIDGPGIRYRRHPEGLTQDVARLAEAQLTVHRRHAALVDEAVAAAAIAADERALRRERLRARLPLRRRDAYRA